MSTNIVLSKSGQTSVTIHTVSVKENWVNAIEQFNRLRTPTTYSKGYQKYVLNFLNLSRVFEIVGLIATEQDGSTTATTLRARMKNIITAGGTATITYNGENITGGLTGLEFREMPADDKTPRFFRVIFSILEAESRI